MHKIIVILTILIIGCASAKKVDESDYKFYIKEWKCDNNNNLLMLLGGYPNGGEFWVMEIEQNGIPKKTKNCININK